MTATLVLGTNFAGKISSMTAVVEIVIRYQSFSDQDHLLSEQIWFWLDKTSRQIK